MHFVPAYLIDGPEAIDPTCLIQLVSFPLTRGLLEKRQIKKTDSKKKLKEKVKHSGKIFNERDAL